MRAIVLDRSHARSDRIMGAEHFRPLTIPTRMRSPARKRFPQPLLSERLGVDGFVREPGGHVTTINATSTTTNHCSPANMKFACGCACGVYSKEYTAVCMISMCTFAGETETRNRKRAIDSQYRLQRPATPDKPLGRRSG
jgi:hypothetical protein